MRGGVGFEKGNAAANDTQSATTRLSFTLKMPVPNRSPATRVRFGEEETRSTDEKRHLLFAVAFFEPCGVISDDGTP